MMRWALRALVGIAALVSIVTATLSAQAAKEPLRTGLGFGAKVGFGTDPTQFVLGAQLALGKAGFGLLRVVPNAHLAFGDVTTFDLNVDFLARLVLADKGIGLYGGIAPTYTMGSENSDFGGTWILGAQLPVLRKNATNLEARLGFGGTPSFRLLAVIVF